MQTLDSIHQSKALPQAVTIGRGERRVAAAADDESAAEDRFKEIELEEMSKIVIKKWAYYQKLTSYPTLIKRDI